MNKKIQCISFISILVLSLTNLFAIKYKILSCNPSEINQGDQKITLNLTTNLPLLQTSKNPNLYPEVQFSALDIHVDTTVVMNNFIVNCQVSVDRDADISKPADITMTTYDENGNDIVFEGKKLLKINRQSIIDKVVVHNWDGKIKQGETANLTIKGYNFQTGDVSVLVMMSGLAPINASCDNARQIKFELLDSQTKNLQKGKYGIYIYNKDGSGCKIDEAVEVV